VSEGSKKASRARSKFCSLSTLHNESDVEQSFLRPLIEELGYSADYTETKATIAAKNVGKGTKPRPYRPDFVCYADKGHRKPVLVIDAKHPTVAAEQGLGDAQLYATILRRGLTTRKPDQYCIGSNGTTTIVRFFDSDVDAFRLDFSDFVEGNPKFAALRAALGRSALAATAARTSPAAHFAFDKPPIPTLLAIFEACHNLIWRREKCPPAEAFYEFAKILFVKLRKDRDLAKKAAHGPLSPSDVEVSVSWIESLESANPNPFNSVHFQHLRDTLEAEIAAGTKKRMFDPGEDIKLKPSTIKEVVRLLEHLNLHSIDEDLNGRMFETFLTAVIRGRSLGQYFTPRTVVKFMVDVARLTIAAKRVPRILDACCGTGGFLIEALARLTDTVTNNPSLSNAERSKLIHEIRMERLWGIEANETIARVARINMYLHQDGGSRIYRADALDKEFQVEPNVVGEAQRDFDELRTALGTNGTLFDVVLSNPPFAMRYESKKADERRLLREYVLARRDKGKLVASLRSSVMFVERYYDLLRDKGILLTIIDDSVLNTTTAAFVRSWIRSHFFIRAIISLPKNCFVVAGSASKTSILVLEKKATASEDQPSVFMAKSLNVGHTDTGKPELSKSDLPAILMEWTRFRDSGTLPTRPGSFVVRPENLAERLDVQWYDPEYLELYKRLEAVPHFKLRDLKPLLKYGASIDADYTSDVPFLRIENLRRNDIDVSDLQFVPSTLYAKQLKSLYLHEGDILIARSGTYVGLCAAVGSGLEKYVYGSYMIRLRLRDHKRVVPQFLALYLNSRVGQMQFDRVKTGSLQFNINQQQIQDIIVPEIPVPEQEAIVADFFTRLRKIKSARQGISLLEADFADGLGAKITASAGIKGKLSLRDFSGG
jgi:type I restriction enzyme M protein